jgi:hypothetical protein
MQLKKTTMTLTWTLKFCQRKFSEIDSKLTDTDLAYPLEAIGSEGGAHWVVQTCDLLGDEVLEFATGIRTTEDILGLVFEHQKKCSVCVDVQRVASLALVKVIFV